MSSKPYPKGRLSAHEIADVLATLYSESFGGKKTGKYRISRKYLRQLAGRKRLPPGFIDQIGEELFERGLVIADLESFFVVLDQRLFNSYRRVTSAAIGTVIGEENMHGTEDESAEAD